MDRATRVLFIEDDAAARDGYVTYLTAAGYDVIPAASGNEALTLAQTLTIDVVVLDLGLPDIDGWEVARQLRAHPQTATIPILALTGAGLAHEVVSSMRAGCDRHLAKPCAPEEVLATIQLLIADASKSS